MTDDANASPEEVRAKMVSVLAKYPTEVDVLEDPDAGPDDWAFWLSARDTCGFSPTYFSAVPTLRRTNTPTEDLSSLFDPDQPRPVVRLERFSYLDVDLDKDLDKDL